MKILLDLQACQTEGSRTRGIGRYSMALARAMLEVGQGHEFWVLLHAGYPEASAEIRAALVGLIPEQHIVEFQASVNQPWMQPDSKGARAVAAAIRDQVIHQINPDAIHIGSIFEGSSDQAVVSLDDAGLAQRSWITLYDLIPLIHADTYLQDAHLRAWYYHRLGCLRRAAGLLAISESSRQEGLDYLRLPAERVHTISTAIGDQFQSFALNSEQQQRLAQQYDLTRPFIMYTGGVDHRKNIDGLILAYADLPSSLRQQYQLAIVCSVRPEDRQRLGAIARKAGLAASDVVFTGFVSEVDLVLLYNACALFVFPSLHEGFGLPVLEAMACGAAVICSDCSSLPEVIGLAEAMFDPHDQGQITSAMQRALSDQAFRQRLLENGQQRPVLFSWHRVAASALAAMERHTPLAAADVSAPVSPPVQRTRLAYISPLPPARSGVALYADHLLAELLQHYDITLVTPVAELASDWAAGNCDTISPAEFLQTSAHYDRVVYQMGNSDYHGWMLDLLNHRPGVVVLHDCYLGGLFHHQSRQGDKGCLERALFQSHGYAALYYLQQQGVDAAIKRYSCSAPVLDRARKVLVHSAHAAELVQGHSSRRQLAFEVMPLPVPLPTLPERVEARRELGIAEDVTLILSLGFIAPDKCNELLLEAFLTSPALQQSNSQLHLVGDDYGSAYGDQLRQRIQQAGMQPRIKLTGYVSPQRYQHYLAAGDIAVQLRANSRGESSAAVLEAMSAGLPLILNRHGSAAEIPADCCFQLPEQPSHEALRTALEQLLSAEQQRAELAARARQFIQRQHAPAATGQHCVAAIEQSWQQPASRHHDQLIQQLAQVRNSDTGHSVNWPAAAQDIATNTAMQWRPRQLIELEAGQLQAGGLSSAQQRQLVDLLTQAPVQPRIELVYRCDGQLWHAHQAGSQILGLARPVLPDCLLVAIPGDQHCSLNDLFQPAESASPVRQVS